MISKALDRVLRSSYLLSTHLRHEMTGLEHLLHAIADDPNGALILKSCGANIDELRNDLVNFFKRLSIRNDESTEPIHTIGFRRTLQRALVHSQAAEQEETGIGDLLVSMFAENDSHAVYYLEKQEISRLDVLHYVSHRIAKPGFEQPDDVTDDPEETFEENLDENPEENAEEADHPGQSEYEDASSGKNAGTQRDKMNDEDTSGTSEQKERPARKADLLQLYAGDWTAYARDGQFDKVIGRDMEIDRTIEILCRRKKNNPIFVGDPGVGKTAITQGLAQKIASGDVPERIRGHQIHALDLGAMLAGTKYRGDFEARFKGVLKTLRKKENTILFIDEIHSIVGAGAAGSSTMDASNMLKPLLADGSIRCIGATTFEEYKNHFEKDRALSRRFQKIEIDEPDIPTTIEILKGLKGVYEDYHGLKITASSLEAAARLSAKYLTDRRLPDKAIDVIDEACAQVSLRPGRRKQLIPKDIEILVSKIARVPVHQVGSAEKESLRDLENVLNSNVYGQEQAVRSLVTAVKRSRAGLGNENKPVGSFLFTGPTGVGKTELCRQVADKMGIPLIRFDMSEYMEKHTVSRLIGAPAGYVGFEQGGLLTDAIRRQPNSVLLLDEIEKAHPDIFNILLQIMDYATATDNTGRKADFRNVLLVMTSNIGSREMSSTRIGFSDSKTYTPGSGPDKSIERHFSPEFRNRLDDIIVFRHLDRTVVESIVYKFIRELEEQLRDKKVSIQLTKKAVDWLADKGYDPAYGARPMSRVIQESIKNRLVEELLFGKLVHGGTVTLSANNGKLTFKFAVS